MTTGTRVIAQRQALVHCLDRRRGTVRILPGMAGTVIRYQPGEAIVQWDELPALTAVPLSLIARAVKQPIHLAE